MIPDSARVVGLAAVVAVSVVALGLPPVTAGTPGPATDAGVAAAGPTRTTVTGLAINDSGFVSEPQQARTIFDDFPANGSAVFAASGATSTVLRRPREGHLAGVADAKELVGQHVGVTGLPVQTDAYAEQEPALNYQQRGQPAPHQVNPRQELSLRWEVVADEAVDTETVRLEYDEAAAAGLQVNRSATQALVDANSEASDLRGWIEYDLGDGDPTGGERQGHVGGDGTETNDIVGVDIDNAANEVAITYQNRANATVTSVDLVLVWEPQDAVEGLDVADDLDERIDHVFRGPAGDTVEDGFRLVDTGATAVAPGDRGSEDSVIGTDVSAVDLAAEGRADGTPVGDGTEDATAFHVWHGQTVTFVAASPTQSVRVHRVAEAEDADGDAVYARGDTVFDRRGLPGQAVTMDTRRLSAGERYFVTFGENRDRVAVLDVRPLDVRADAPAEAVASGRLEVDVSSADTTGNEVEAWFLEAGDADVGDVVHVEDATLDGTGDATVRVAPEADLGAAAGEEYYAWIVHPESETLLATDTVEVVAAKEGRVTIASPTAADEFARGDIVPIELSFENTDRGTVSIGDRDAHNIEINVTVRDTDGDGAGTIYLNTFQVGHGYLAGGAGDAEPNAAGEGAFASRNHGFFTLPDDGVALDGRDGQSAIAHPEMAITGGSQGGAVMQDYAYDLSSVAGGQPPGEAAVVDDRTQLAVTDRSNVSTSLWTAPGAGVNAIDPETVEDIDAGVEGGVITPAGGVIAERDVVVMAVRAEGWTGIFHEAIRENDSNDVEVSDLFDRDDVITRLWHLQADHLAWRAEAREPTAHVPADGTRLTVDLAGDRVIAGGRNGAFDRYYFVLALESGANETIGSRPLRPPQELEATVAFTATDDTRLEGFLAPTHRHIEPVRVESPVADIDPAKHRYDAATHRIEVPPRGDYEIAGVTNVAAGSNLTVEVSSTPDAETPFSAVATDVSPRYVADRDRQVWTATVPEAFADAQPGTEFEIRVRRQGAAGTINPGEMIEGEVRQPPAVTALTFADQDSPGGTVRIDELETTHGGYVRIMDAAGNEIGRSNRLAEGDRHRDVEVTLEEPLAAGDHELTASVYRAADEPYRGDAQATAVISVEPEATATEADDPTGTAGDGGTGVAVVLVGVVVAASLLGRRRDRT